MSKFCLNIDYLDEPKKKKPDRESSVRKIVSLRIKKRVSINQCIIRKFFFLYSTKYGQIHIWLKNERLKQSVYCVI